ncbi:cell division protein FtsQ/DivIB [Marinicrinis sediminis]|uniref:Cell division protein DivIB n=1 Tax=Marinicrinis sediminis TaxID=1652465 RepID=A0ABW5RC92_9BACL
MNGYRGQASIPAMKKQKRPRKKSRRLLALIFCFFVILLAVLFFRSSFSQITSIEVTGNRWLSHEQILAQSGITVGESYFMLNEQKLRDNLTQRKEIENVKTEKSFPGKLVIHVEEHDAVAYEGSPDGELTILLANGAWISAADRVQLDKPLLTGWEDQTEGKKKLARVLAEIPPRQLMDISEIRPLPATSSYEDKILLYTRSQFEVVTTIDYLKDKIDVLEGIIEELRKQGTRTGEITLLEAIIHRPFPGDEQQDDSPTTLQAEELE